METRRKEKIWAIINTERKKREKVNEAIKIEEWKEHYMRLLGGVEERVIRGKEGEE